MPFERPTLGELVTRTRSDFRSRLGIQGSLLRRAMADVVATVWAGSVHLLHGHLDWLSRQLFIRTAEPDILLREHLDIIGITQAAAEFASGAVTATGENDSPIPEDEILVRDDGVTYRVTEEAVIAGGEAEVSVEAVEAGAAGNLAADEELAFESPVTGVDSTVTVSGDGITGGFDQEDIELTRQRGIDRKREPPQGGAEHDYRAWALAVAGVTRAWVFAHEEGLGTVVVRFVLDGEEDIFPGAAMVETVQEALDEQRPVTDEAIAAAPEPLEVDFTLSVTPDTEAVREAVEAELEDLLFREAVPGDGEGRGTILLSRILTAIGVAPGVEDFTLAAPAADVVPGVGELAVMGTVTWT